MADDDGKTDPPEGNDPDPQEEFWKEHEKRMDAWFDKRIKKLREESTGTSRTGGRAGNPITDVLKIFTG